MNSNSAKTMKKIENRDIFSTQGVVGRKTFIIFSAIIPITISFTLTFIGVTLMLGIDNAMKLYIGSIKDPSLFKLLPNMANASNGDKFIKHLNMDIDNIKVEWAPYVLLILSGAGAIILLWFSLGFLFKRIRDIFGEFKWRYFFAIIILNIIPYVGYVIPLFLFLTPGRVTSNSRLLDRFIS